MSQTSSVAVSVSVVLVVPVKPAQESVPVEQLSHPERPGQSNPAPAMYQLVPVLPAVPATPDAAPATPQTPQSPPKQ